MDEESAPEPDESRTRYLAIPSAAPAVWPCAGVDGLVVWDFLGEPDPHRVGQRRPWLLVNDRPGPFGAERFAVPRLVPSCEWADQAASDSWHEDAFRGVMAPIPTHETVIDARAAQPSQRGRRANERSVLLARIAVVIECDLRQRSTRDLARERETSGEDAGTAQRNVRRDRQEGRKLLAGLGGLPWAAFPGGELAERWWQSEKFAADLDRWCWHASLLAYRDKWERPVHALSPAQEVVYRLLRLPDGQRLRPETLAVARATLEVDAGASDALSVDQWVARLELAARPGCVDPHQVLHDFPVLREAWSNARPVADPVPRR